MSSDLIEGIQFFLGQHDLRLMHPERLLLLLAIPVFLLIGFWMGRDLRWYRRWLIQLLRAMVVAALAIALARPVEISRQKAPAVVFLADLSDSLPAAERQRMHERIDSLWSERGEASTFVVGFGKQPEVLARPGAWRVALPGERGDDVTDIASALRFSYSLFPPRHDRRVVIFSDGVENRGDLRDEAMRARAFGIQVSTWPLVPSSSVDLRLDKLTAPAAVRAGDRAEVEAVVFSNARRTTALLLLLDGERAERRVVRVGPGSNRFAFSLQLDEAGWHRITVRAAARDRYPHNNWAATRVHVAGRPRVLLVQSGEGANPLQKLIAGQDLDLTRVGPDGIPSDFAKMTEYDLIFLDDLELGELSRATVDLLRSYVEEYAGGLILTAGQAASELAGPEDAPIEPLLPVHFRQVKKKEKVPAALVFVMDRSSSMARSGKFMILLRAVVDAIERLKDNVQVAMIMFDDFPEVVVPLCEAKQRDKIRKVLTSQRIGGGTSIYPALQKAHRELKKSAARLKHVILLSDGQSISMYAQYGYIVEKMAEDHITVTAIALGEDADQPELKRIAARSGGHYYFTDNMANVPKIFSSETEKLTESNVVEQPIRAVPAKLVEVLAGIDFEGAPPLGGYVASEPRPTSEVLLTSSDRAEPILARWRYGLGRVVVLTSDAQGTWAGAWTQWEGFATLWPRLVRDTIRSTPPGDLRLHGEVEEDRAVLTMQVPAERPGENRPPPGLTALDPAAREQPLEVVRRGLGLYRAEMQLDRLGPYSFVAERTGKRGAMERSYTSLSRTYKEEYLAAGADTALLEEVARLTGGGVRPAAEEIFAPGRQERRSREEKWPPFVLAALGLFLAEVFFRRI